MTMITILALPIAVQEYGVWGGVALVWCMGTNVVRCTR